MAKSITLIFNTSPLVVIDDVINLSIDTGVGIINYQETFKASRSANFQVTIPSPYNNEDLAFNFANAWNLDYKITSIGDAKDDIIAFAFENTVTIYAKDDSWDWQIPTGSAITSGAISYSIPVSPNVIVNSYSENSISPCGLVDVELGITGGTGLYDIYVSGILTLEDQVSPVTVSLVRGLPKEIDVKDSNNDIIGSVFIDDTSGINSNDITVEITEPSTTLVEIIVNNSNTTIEPFTYSLNGVDYFLSNSFLDVADGTYTAYVKDAFGCITTYTFTVGEGLVYYSQYDDVVGIIHNIEIYKAGSIVTPTEIECTAILEYPEEKDCQEPIKPCGLSLSLLASETLSFSDLYSEEERTYRVIYKRNDVVLFNGWLSSDGLYESYVNSKWFLELNCIDGFGYLKDLRYVENNTGLNFVGKQTGLDIIINCLKRTNLEQNLRTSVNIYYEGLEDVNILDNIYFNTERFIKDDDNTVMDCEEVLKSILEIFNASIIYFEGYWYVYRANEIFDSSNLAFYEYDLDKTFIQQSTIQIGASIGNIDDGFYPHHINANQRKSLERSLGAYRVNLKWGKVFPYYENSDLIWDNPATTIDDWTLNIPADIRDEDGRGFYMERKTEGISVVLTSDNYVVSSNPRVDFSFTFSNTKPFFYTQVGVPRLGGTALNIKVKYVKGGNTYWLNRDGFWGSDTLIQYAISANEQNFTLRVISEQVPEEDGALFMEIYSPGFGNAKGDILISNISVATYNAEDSAQGQNYTIEKKANYTPNINDEVKKVFNGDIEDGTYYGTIYQNDQTTETEFWNRNGIIENKNLLRIMVEDRMRMNYNPKQIFEGDLYGYLPYFSILAINNINGKFLPIDYSYDTKNNIVSLKSKELFNEQFEDVDVIYSSSLDYGNVVKPTIKG